MFFIKRKHLIKLKKNLVQKYKLFSRTKAFEKRYENVDSKLFIKSLSDEILGKYRDKWSVFGIKVEVDTFLLCYNLSEIVDYNIVPENIFAAIIEPNLNNHDELSFLSIKNIYQKWFDNSELFPKSYFHKIDGIYYDDQLRLIDDIDYYLEKLEFAYPIICKPSMDTYGGEGVITVNNLNEVKQSLSTYENLVYQEKIQQNKTINKINPGMSSIRTCLYRGEDGRFTVLNNSIRFGINGGLDNETAGGIVCNIKKNGGLHNYAVNKYCKKYIAHPNSKVIFSEITIPFYEKLGLVAEEIANQIPLGNLVSLDMCLDVNNNWRCIEINLSGQTIRFAQYAGVGFFGEHTEDAIKKVLSKR